MVAWNRMSDLVRGFRGVFGFPVTPFHDDLTLDLEALAAHVEELAAHPFCALIPAGGLGELYSLSPEEVEAVVRVTVAHARGIPVLAGTGYHAVLGADLARRAARAGAQGLLVFPPYYPNAPEEGLFRYYEAIGRATDLPLLLYSRDWAAFTPPMVERLAERVPTLHGWKDGQGDVRKLRRIMSHCGERLAWFGGSGDDNAPAYFAIGVQAYTSSISAIAPKLAIAIAEAGLRRDFAALGRLMSRYVDPLFAIRERLRGYEVAAMKQALELLGRRAGPVRPPLCPLRPGDLDDLRKLMEIYQEVL